MGLAVRVGAVSAFSLGLTFLYAWLAYVQVPSNPIQHAIPLFGFVLLVFFGHIVLGLLALR